MSSIKLESLINEFPEEAVALMRLKDYVDSLQSSGKYKEFSLERIYEIAEPSSCRVLLSILGRLCQQGVVSESFRVLSPSGDTIKDFSSIEEVPVKLTDWRTGARIEVDLSLLRMVYKVNPISHK